MLSTAPEVLSAQLQQQYREKGFVLGPRVLSDEQADALSEEVLRVIASRDDANAPKPDLLSNLGKPPQEIWQIVNIWCASDAFRRLMENPIIVESARQLLGGNEMYIWHDQIQYKPAAKGGTNWWHQDSIYWGVHAVKDAQITAWVALDDADTDNGCMWMIPGSHQWADQIAYLHAKREELGLNRFLELTSDHHGKPVQPVACPVKRGHVHFHHPLTWHGSPANNSGRPRRAIALHYMNERVTFDAKGGHVLKPHIKVEHGQPVRGQRFPRLWPAA